MDTATKNLENDHELILRLIEVIVKMTRADNFNIAHFEKAAYIIRNFADGFHHSKEENIFFPMLAKRGFSTRQGPVAVMIHEHTEGRDLVKKMSEAIDQFKEGDSSAKEVIFYNALEYCKLLGSHISKENNILFRMADNALSDSDQLQLLSDFGDTEKSKRNEDLKRECIASIGEFELVYE